MLDIVLLGNWKLKQLWDSISQLKSKTLPTPNIGDDREQKKFTRWFWECKMVQPLWKRVWQFLPTLKLNICYSHDPVITLLCIYPNELKTCPHKNLHTNVFSRWMDKLWYIHTMEYYSAIKRYEVSSHEKTWKKLKLILLVKQANLKRQHTIWFQLYNTSEKVMAPHSGISCLENPMDGGAWWSAFHGVAKSRTWLCDFTFTFHFHALEKEMATRSSVLAWRIPRTGEPGGLPSMGSHRVRHDWSDLAAAAAYNT